MGLDTFDDEEKPTIEQQIGGKHNDGFILEDAIIVKKQGKEQHSNDKLKKELPEGIGDERIHNGNTGKGPMIVDGEKEQEEELSGRLKSMKRIGELMTTISPMAFDKCLSKASEPVMMFGIPKFHLETFGGIEKGQLGNGVEHKSSTIFQQLAKFHNKFGIRHFVLIGLLAIYSIFGGLMFEAIERENEIQNMKKTSRLLDRSISMLAFKINDTLNANATFDQHGQLKLLIKQYYLEMLKIEDKYVGSVFHKYETLDMKKVLSWYFGSSVFYAMTLFTTIGYGTIACQTPLGKIASIFYAIFGIPLTLVVLSDLGQLMLQFFTFIYERGSQKCKNWLRLLAIHILKSINHTEDGFPESKGKRTNDLEMFDQCTESIEENYNRRIVASEFPLSLAIIIVSIYFLFVSFLVSNFDWDETGGDRKLSFGDAFYFAFFSITTIGLGDVMPSNLQYSPILAIVFLFGLALLSVVNSTIYMRIHCLFMELVDTLEEYLECVNQNDGQKQGYFIFKSLGPSIQLLALALPIFPDDKEDQIGAMLEPENTNLGRRFFPNFSFPKYKLSRAHTMGTFDSFRPTLGILNTAPPSRKGTVFGGEGGVDNSSCRKWEEDCPSGRRRAATISSLNIPPAGEMMAKTLRWEDQQMGNRNFLRKVQRIYTRRGGERQFGPNSMARSRINLRRVQSEHVPPSMSSSLSTIVESGEAEEGAERRMRYIFENASPRRMRRMMMMRRGEGKGGMEIGRGISENGD